jgi:protein arginine kinase activator
MKCQKCGKHEATTHFTEIINGLKKESFLCQQCAQDGNVMGFKSVFDDNFETFFKSLWGAPKLNQDISKNYKECPNCKTTLFDIQKQGRLGCSECYQVFGSFLMQPLKEIHGSNNHIGKTPKRLGKPINNTNEIDMLKDELNRAVLDQNFEKAAQLRDKIKELEASGKES